MAKTSNIFLPSRFLNTNGSSLNFAAYAFLILICIAFFIPGIATLPPTDKDESSFAQASKQMIETGNYVDIRLQDKPRYKKPVGIYWLQVASVKLFNSQNLNEIWAYRIPSAVGATVAVVMTAAIGTLLFGPAVGFFAALMMAGCTILNVEARLAKTDAALLGSVVVMQYGLARAYLQKKPKWHMPVLFWTALGIGILIKGPIILLVLASTLLWLRLSDKSLQWFNCLKPWYGLLYLLLLVLPWFVAIALQSHGTFMTESAGRDLFAKLWQGQDRGILPPGVHLLAFPILFFPFSLFALLAIPDIWENRKTPAVKFCLGWIVPTWIIFELSLTKLPHYTLPIYPAIAILAAAVLVKGYASLADKGWFTVPVITVWFMIGFGYAVLFALAPYIDNHIWNIPQIAVAAILVIAQSACLFLLFQNRSNSIIAMVLGSLCFMGCTFGLMLPSLQHLWVSREIAHAAAMLNPCDDLQIVSTAYGEPSLVFLAGTKTKIVDDAASAAEEMKHDRCIVGVVDAKHKQAFSDAFAQDATKPAPMATITGFNTGFAKRLDLTLYLLPRKQLSQ